MAGSKKKIHRGLKALFDAILDEVKDNPDFGAKLEAAFVEFAPKGKASAKPLAGRNRSKAGHAGPLGTISPEFLHPTRDLAQLGEEGLLQRLAPISEGELGALIEAHNLDPAGKTADERDAQALRKFIVAAAKKKLARDAKTFNY